MADATVSTKVDNYMTGTTQFATGLTAGTTQTQAGALALTSIINDVTTVAVDLDGVKLPTAVADDKITIYNNGAKVMKVWPNTLDNIGDGVDLSTTTIDPGEFGVFLAKDTTNWLSVISTPSNGVTLHTTSATLTRAQMSNGHRNNVNATATLTMRAADTQTNFEVYTIGAVEVKVEAETTDRIILDGTALADSYIATNLSTAGDALSARYDSAAGVTASTNGWTGAAT